MGVDFRLINGRFDCKWCVNTRGWCYTKEDHKRYITFGEAKCTDFRRIEHDQVCERGEGN